eukprot:CAMPEP_0176339754 /NCGR_PEP_ID=MMETSP0126-20121128/1035_1 /TAXON_ID=141414 ORGANISM="Strombidinopsis acuminatum, Strain SPMC142" /NCGR_SAMPLE_ID=MMETSP0126 /ASSEMBLY_ACC=CAM_ASM_000229 /LENGTH=73 /DNA_ID=CAMNT_0017683569 /DNA_START=905 /DNA_END=1126 /DNA_ORIENTATION=+
MTDKKKRRCGGICACACIKNRRKKKDITKVQPFTDYDHDRPKTEEAMNVPVVTKDASDSESHGQTKMPQDIEL